MLSEQNLSEKLEQLSAAATQGVMDIAAILDRRDATIAHLTTERDALLIALHDAIRRPMGVVPASAGPFYTPAMADQAEAIRALKSTKPIL